MSGQDHRGERPLGGQYQDMVRDYTETRYAAKSWSQPRRVGVRIEATYKGLDIRMG